MHWNCKNCGAPNEDDARYLDISKTQVRDLKPLSGLTNLRQLRIDGTNVTDLSPIAGLPLEYLSVSKSLEKQAKELFPEEIIEVFDD